MYGEVLQKIMEIEIPGSRLAAVILVVLGLVLYGLKRFAKRIAERSEWDPADTVESSARTGRAGVWFALKPDYSDSLEIEGDFFNDSIRLHAASEVYDLVPIEWKRDLRTVQFLVRCKDGAHIVGRAKWVMASNPNHIRVIMRIANQSEMYRQTFKRSYKRSNRSGWLWLF